MGEARRRRQAIMAHKTASADDDCSGGAFGPETLRASVAAVRRMVVGQATRETIRAKAITARFVRSAIDDERQREAEAKARSAQSQMRQALEEEAKAAANAEAERRRILRLREEGRLARLTEEAAKREAESRQRETAASMAAARETAEREESAARMAQVRRQRESASRFAIEKARAVLAEDPQAMMLMEAWCRLKGKSFEDLAPAADWVRDVPATAIWNAASDRVDDDMLAWTMEHGAVGWHDADYRKAMSADVIMKLAKAARVELRFMNVPLLPAGVALRHVANDNGSTVYVDIDRAVETGMDFSTLVTSEIIRAVIAGNSLKTSEWPHASRPEYARASMLDEIATVYGDAILRAIVNPYGCYDHQETTAAIRGISAYADFSDRDLDSAFRSACLFTVPFAERALKNVDRLRDMSILSLEDDILAMQHAIQAYDERRGRIAYQRLLSHQRANEHDDIHMPIDILLVAPESWRPISMTLDRPDGWLPHDLTVVYGDDDSMNQDRDRGKRKTEKNSRGSVYDDGVMVDLYDVIDADMHLFP